MAWEIKVAGVVRGKAPTKAAAHEACRKAGLYKWTGPKVNDNPGMFARLRDDVEIVKAEAGEPGQ